MRLVAGRDGGNNIEERGKRKKNRRKQGRGRGWWESGEGERMEVEQGKGGWEERKSRIK